MKFNIINYKLKIVIWLLALLMAAPSLVSAQGAIDSAFNPGLLIPDKAFSDVGTFGSAEGVQKFLELKNSVLANTNPEFLAKLKEPDTLTKVRLEDPQPSLSRLRTAAELIYDAATHWGMNPQVLLVMLQKEQSLITGNFNSGAALQTALDRAVGFGCPDDQPCGDIFIGFYRQLFGSFDNQGNRWLGTAASLMKSFNTPGGRGPGVDANNQVFGRPLVRTAKIGDTVVFGNTLGGYENVPAQQTVTLANAATAALYRYTPHVFNGNYNFWKFYALWFKYPNGTVIQRVGDSQQYVIDNGTKRSFSSFVAAQRQLNLNNIVAVSQTKFDSYTTEKPLPPVNGTLIKGEASETIYLVEDASKHPISYQVFIQRKFSFTKVISLPQAEVDSYNLGNYLAPIDGTLITGNADQTVYLVYAGQKRPISYVIFKVRKLSFAKVVRLSDGEIANIPAGPYLTPPEQTGFKTANDAQVWWYKDNLKHSVTAFVFKQRAVANFPFLILSESEVANIPTGAAFPPKDGTVFKGDVSSAIYLMQDGLKKMLTAAAYQRMRYPKATVLPQAEVDSYNPGDDIVK